MPETHRVQRLLAPSRGTHTYWIDKDPVIFEGVIGLTKDRLFPGSLEYFIGDGTHKYSELPKYGGAEASILSKAYTLVLRDANGKIDSSSIDFPEVPDATPTSKGVVKASVTKAGDNVVKADANGGLGGWKDAISDAVANPSAGLVKNSDGTLGVDFDQMPTNKFEALLKSLKMLVPLEANLDLYVDKNHSASGDSIVDGRGTQAMPFKTIQAAVNFVTQTYAINTHSVYIKVSNATYDECLTLPTYSRTTGAINIEAWDYNNPPTIHASDTWRVAVSVGGGPWYIKRLNITGNYVIPETNVPTYNALISVSGPSAQLTVYGCSAWAEVTGNAQSVFTRCNLYEAAFNGNLEFAVLDNYPNTFHLVKGNVNSACVFQIAQDSAVNFYDTNTNSAALSMSCSGSCSIFCDVFANGKVDCVFGGLYHPEFTGTMTGKKYEAGTSGTIIAPTNGFPGDTAGTAVSAEFSYYKEY